MSKKPLKIDMDSIYVDAINMAQSSTLLRPHGLV